MQAKQLQIDDLLVKLDNASADMDRLREEKDQEIAILQEGMYSTIQQLHDAQQVRGALCLPLLPSFTHIQNQGISEEATNAQIDTLILDNRKKLNAIIGKAYVASSRRLSSYLLS